MSDLKSMISSSLSHLCDSGRLFDGLLMACHGEGESQWGS